jgi:hypothetical protein
VLDSPQHQRTQAFLCRFLYGGQGIGYPPRSLAVRSQSLTSTEWGGWLAARGGREWTAMRHATGEDPPCASGCDAELRRHNEVLRRAVGVQFHDRVLDRLWDWADDPTSRADGPVGQCTRGRRLGDGGRARPRAGSGGRTPPLMPSICPATPLHSPG